MDVKILIAVVALASTVYGQVTSNRINNQSNQNLVPGVFISADTLRNLEARAQQNEHNVSPRIQPNSSPQDQRNDGTTYPTGTNEPTYNNNYNGQVDPLKTNPAYQPNYENVPRDYQQPNYNSQNQRPLGIQQPLGNQQPVLNQPVPSNQQPIFLTPAQAPSQQALLVNQQQGYPNQQQFLVNQQPALVTNPNFTPLNLGQPTLFATNPVNNQPTILTRPINTNSNQGPLYAMVPVNGPNNIQNLGNGNAVLVPLPQPPNQIISLNPGK